MDLQNQTVDSRIRVGETLFDIPVKYTDTTAFMAFFPIPRKKAEEILGTNRLNPVSILGNRSILGLTVFDYKSCQAGPYREVAISVPVIMDSKINIPILPLLAGQLFPNFYFYSILLAMNTDLAMAHSEEIFGYPTFKRKVDVDFKKELDMLTISSREGGSKIFSLKTRVPKKTKKIKTKFRTCFKKDGLLYSVNLYAEADETNFTDHSNFDFELGNHEISKIIGDLKINPRPMQCVFYREAVEILDLPQNRGKI